MGDHEAAGAAVIGPPGIGKTRLVNEALRRIPAQDFEVLRTVGSADLSATSFAAVANWLPPAKPEMTELQILQSALSTLEARPAGARLIVFVDDAHLLDDGSAGVLSQLAVRKVAGVILAVRAGAPLPEAIRKLQHDLLAPVRLGPLASAELEELACIAVGGPVARLAVAGLEQLSEGKPRYAIELLTEAVTSGAFVRRGEAWTLTGSMRLGDALGDMVRAQLAPLEPSALHTLEILALAERVDWELLAACADANAVELLETRGLVTVRQDGRRSLAQVTSPIVAEAIRQSLPFATARRLSGLLSDGCTDRAMRRRSDQLNMAKWTLTSGRHMDATTAIGAARLALDEGASQLAEQLAQLAWDQKGETEALILLAQALTQQGRTAQAEALLIAEQSQAATEGELVRLALGRMRNLMYFGGRAQEAIDAGVQAIARIRDPAWKDELTAEVAILAAHVGDYERAVVIGSLAIRPGTEDRLAVGSLLVSALGQVMLGHFDDVDDIIERGLRLTPRVADEIPLAADMFKMHREHARMWRGEPGAAEAATGVEYEQAMRSGSSGVLGLWAAHHATALLIGGKVSEAVRMYRDSLAHLEIHDPLQALPVVRCWSAMAAAQAGDDERCEQLLANLDHEYLVGEFRLDALRERARAWQLASRGELSQAAKMVAEAGRSLLEHSHRAWGVLTLHDAVRFDHPEVVAEELLTHAGSVDGMLAPVLVGHAQALSAHDGAALDACARDFASMGMSLLAAEAARQAAQVHRADDNCTAAARSNRRADQLASQCEGARTPALRDEVRFLTRREYEVAAMAAAGSSNREIADRLHISMRTVENHLGTAYTKLGIHRRTELGDLLAPMPPRPPERSRRDLT